MKIEELKDIVNDARINIVLCKKNIARLQKKLFSDFGIKNEDIGKELRKRTKEIDSFVKKEKRLFAKANNILRKISEGEENHEFRD